METLSRCSSARSCFLAGKEGEDLDGAPSQRAGALRLPEVLRHPHWPAVRAGLLQGQREVGEEARKKLADSTTSVCSPCAPHRAAPAHPIRRTAPHLRRTTPARRCHAPHRAALHHTAPRRTTPRRTTPRRTAPHRTASHQHAHAYTAPRRGLAEFRGQSAQSSARDPRSASQNSPRRGSEVCAELCGLRHRGLRNRAESSAIKGFVPSTSWSFVPSWGGSLPRVEGEHKSSKREGGKKERRNKLFQA